MFEELKRYRIILVTGPQRSGTTLAAHCIAQDTGHHYIDEADYGTKNGIEWRRLIVEESDAVIQCPSMARWVHEVATEDVLVVWMLRSAHEIMASQFRVGWIATIERAKYPVSDKPICLIKLDFWRETQKQAIPHWLEVPYHSLKLHPLWVNDRQEWLPRQWQPTQEIIE
jgi:hypothetical protein